MTPNETKPEETKLETAQTEEQPVTPVTTATEKVVETRFHPQPAQPAEPTPPTDEEKPKRKRFVLPEPPKFSKKHPLKVKFHVGKNFIRQMVFKEENISKYFMAPLLTEYKGRTISDEINPRSHGEDCLRSPVAKKIEATIHDAPHDFFLANRGTTILCDSVKVDDNGFVELSFTNPDLHGAADGASTDSVIAKVQTLFPDSENLKQARINLEVFVGITDRTRIEHLVGGRNTSRQVKGWSLADFAGRFDFLKKILDKKDSPFFNKIGYEENAGQEVNVLDVLSWLTLFHEEFDTETEKSPAIAYANKGSLTGRLNDPELLQGYENLAEIIPHILNLHDYIHTTFEQKYDEAFKGKSKLGKRTGIDSRKQEEPYLLPLTGTEVSYIIASSYIYPLLGAMRALVKYKKTGDDKGKASWRVSPFRFWDTHGAVLIKNLIQQIDEEGNPNQVAKRKSTYDALYNLARALLFKQDEE